MAAKPVEKPVEKPAEKPTKFTFGSTGSGAAFTYVEPEYFDWAEDDEQRSPVSSPFFEDGCIHIR